MSSGGKYQLAIFASGTGSNADKICNYFSDHPSIRVCLIVTNRSKAGVREVAERHGIACIVIPKSEWAQPEFVLPALRTRDITHIVLAGFLLLLPSYLVSEYQGRIINIHPALLPKFGGYGMHGLHVHEAVKESGDRVSGITIHEVNENYDEGRVLFQKEVDIESSDSVSDISNKVQVLEHYYFPRVIEKWILG